MKDQPYPDSELVQIPVPPGGYPAMMFGAMLEGISRRYPDAKWVVHHGFGDGPFVMHLGEPLYDEDNDDDHDVPLRQPAALQQPSDAGGGGEAGEGSG